MSATMAGSGRARRALRGRRHQRADARWRAPGRLRGDQRRGFRGPVRCLPTHCAASDARPRLSRDARMADGRAARLPGREWVLELHRLRRRPRLHAADQPGGVRDPPGPGHRQRNTFEYTSDEHGGTITHKAEADYLDDGPQKPIRIWSRTGRRPLLAAGNSNGDIPMLEFTHHHDKPPFACSSSTTTASANSTTPTAPSRHWSRPTDGWTIVSIKNDWATVF